MTAKRTSKLHAEDLVALTLFNSDGYRMLHVDFDDLAKRFGKETANRMLDALVPDPAPRPKDWIVETWAARGSVGVALAGKDPFYALSQLAGRAISSRRSGPARSPSASPPNWRPRPRRFRDRPSLSPAALISS
jgi:hypothetical protein